jgi:V/A-type H+-transporting ATPase subunit A
MMAGAQAGRLTAVSGSVVHADLDGDTKLREVVYVGDAQLLGEVIELEGRSATIQVYEETAGLAPGAPVSATAHLFHVELGPGLLGAVFDGLQRPLHRLADLQGDFLEKGRRVPALDRDRVWEFVPRVRVGDVLTGGCVLGIVRETPALEHRVLIPPDVAGRVVDVATAGPRRIADTVATLVDSGGVERRVSLFHTWRVRRPRPFAERLVAAMPMLTGQRVLDTFFPLPQGGACGMPGGFGTGKTIMQHQLCKWAQADVIVYVGCGERGNEMTEMLTKLPDLVDPRNGRPLAERTVLVANTSNMPVPAREASIYTGATIAEYYRDMGYHVVLLADSTSRWAEALRETSGRLGEMPAEEGYPSYLSSRLASYYERAGRVRTLAGAEGSVTLISAISPPGGDLTEPVTRHTQQFTQCFWTLDKTLAESRMFPAISLRESYSHLPELLTAWWTTTISPEWPVLRRDGLALLDEADRAEATARLVGIDSLPQRQQWVLAAARLFQDGFLRQSAFDIRDASCSPARQFRLLRLLLRIYTRGLAALERGSTTQELLELPVLGKVPRAKSEIADHELSRFNQLETEIEQEFSGLDATAEIAVASGFSPTSGKASVALGFSRASTGSVQS